MQQQTIPQSFVQLMQSLYQDTPYSIKVNGEMSDSFYSDIGLLQGCALSPPLYNAYLKDCLQSIEEQCHHMGIKLHTNGGMVCVQAGYADDIHGTVLVEHVPAFLDIVETTFARKQQFLNRPKCKILVVARRPCVDTHIADIEVVREMRILGLMFTHNGSMESNVQARALKGKTKAALHIARLYKHGCLHDPVIASLMVKSDIMPTVLFGCGLWGYHKLAYKDPVEHTLQQPCSVLLRTALGQPHKTAHWIVLMLTGHLPLQYWIIRHFCRFWNKLQHVSDGVNNLVCECLLLQCELMEKGKRCWLRKWCTAFHNLSPALAVHGQCLPQLQLLDEQVVTNSMLASYTAHMNSLGNPFSIQPCIHRRIAWVWQCVMRGPCWGKMPSCLRMTLPPHLRLAWWLFISANTDIPVHDHQLLRTSQFSERICRKCHAHSVADETHVLLYCTATATPRMVFGHCIEWQRDMPSLLASNNGVFSKLPAFVRAAFLQYRKAPVVQPV
jgi:hypothetical protein